MKKVFWSFLSFSLLMLLAVQSWAVPSAPVISCEVEGTHLTINWDDNHEVLGYTLLYAPYPYTGPQSISSMEIGLKTSFSIDLWDGAKYYVAVTAWDASGTSEYSNVEWFTVDAFAPPSAPTIIYNVVGTDLTVSWSSVANATGYILHYGVGANASLEDFMSLDLGSQVSFSYDALVEGVTYQVAVQAYNNDGYSDYSNIELFSVQNTNFGFTDVVNGLSYFDDFSWGGGISSFLDAYHMNPTDPENSQIVYLAHQTFSKRLGIIDTDLSNEELTYLNRGYSFLGDDFVLGVEKNSTSNSLYFQEKNYFGNIIFGSSFYIQDSFDILDLYVDLSGGFIVALSIYDDVNNNYDILLEKFDSDGDFIRHIRCDVNSISSLKDIEILELKEDEILISYANNSEIYLLILDNYGNILSNTYLSEHSLSIYANISVFSLSSGDFLIASDTLTRVDSNGNVVWHLNAETTKLIEDFGASFRSFIELEDGQFLMASSRSLTMFGALKIFKFDPSGRIVWCRSYSEPDLRDNAIAAGPILKLNDNEFWLLASIKRSEMTGTLLKFDASGMPLN